MKMTKEQEISRIKKLVSTAKSIVTGQVGLTIGSFTLSNKLSCLGNDWEAKFPVFNEYRSVLPLDIPVGTERLTWKLEKILEVDPILAKIENKHRSEILEACVNIIKEYGQKEK